MTLCHNVTERMTTQTLIMAILIASLTAGVADAQRRRRLEAGVVEMS